ncbi:MAG: hypothetical protein HP493_04035 [Nitrospira sp.]|nr:hypothetical protein [Nitrospira sp.]
MDARRKVMLAIVLLLAWAGLAVWQWGTWEEPIRVPLTTGGIMGVRSKSRRKPIKQRAFPLTVRHFEGKPTYYDWVFQFPNPSMPAIVPPGAQPPATAPKQSTAPGGSGQADPVPPTDMIPTPVSPLLPATS